eukprot:Em0528g5a
MENIVLSMAPINSTGDIYHILAYLFLAECCIPQVILTHDDTSIEATSTEAASIEGTSTEAASIEATSTEAASIKGTSTEAASIEATSTEAASIEGTSTKAASIVSTEAASIEGTSTKAASIEGTSTKAASIERYQYQAASIKGTSTKAASIEGTSTKVASIKDPYDYGKLLHLQLLLTLKEEEEAIQLKGIIGNTSGTLDLAAFIGHRVFNIHILGQPSPHQYQDCRVIMQQEFFTLGFYQKEHEEKLMQELQQWIEGQSPPAKKIEGNPNLKGEGFWQLFYACDVTNQDNKYPLTINIGQTIATKYDMKLPEGY